jgi:uncharacterized protein YndB with AHSA1/START domain
MGNNKKITIEATVNAPVEKVWQYWIEPKHIMQWNAAAPEWHCPKSENDVRPGGTFSATMAAKDGSFSFDFGGTHDQVEEHKLIASTMGDGRTMEVHFTPEGNGTKVVETFEMEMENTEELQRGGWQAILDNFKAHVENN